MGIAAVKIKLMPSSPEADLGEIENKAKEMIESEEGTSPRFEEEPIAFGLKSITFSFGWPEDKGIEELEKKLGDIENVNSAEIVDMRRAL